MQGIYEETSLRRIVHASTGHYRNEIRVHLKQCNSLAAAGYEVFFVVADGQGDEKIGGVMVVDSGRSTGRLERMFFGSRRVYNKALALNADLYHLHDPELLPMGWRLKKKGKRVVFDSHEDVPKQILGKHYLHPFVRKLVSWGFARYESFVCSRLDGIVGATPSIRDKFKNINLTSIDINNFPMLGELDAKVPWHNKAIEVCYVGTIAQARGVKELVRAMELTRSGARLNMVGAYAEPEVESEVRTYAGWSYVNDHGIQDRRGVAEVLGRSVAGLVNLHPLPNYLDALPIKMFEYMSAGIPVIASGFDLWREIIEESQSGICVDPMNPAEIASAIDYLVTHPDEAQKMGENGRRAVLSHYNWTQEEAKLLVFYEQIMSV
jgi:glycosyltransferase involved in cell wall biosynthesis